MGCPLSFTGIHMANSGLRFFCLILILLCACQQGSDQSATIETSGTHSIYDGLPPIGIKYGQAGIPYGEGIHPGIDYNIPVGTDVVAVSDGIVVYLGEPYNDKFYGGDYGVCLKHGDDFFSVYRHLSRVFVINGQHIKRGQRLGLSGQSASFYAHLHFGLIKNDKKGSGIFFSQSYNPNEFWLNGKPQCFDEHKDYSKNSFKEITHPVACIESP